MGSMNTLGVVSWPVSTERLTIRLPVEDDVDPTWVFRSSPDVHEWLTMGPAGYDEYRERFLSPTRFAKTLVVEYDGRVIGDLMVSVEDAWAQAEVANQARGVQAELGWCFDPAYHGRGLATEAVGALLRLCFEELALRRVTANCFADNVASWRLMERLGMRREAHTKADSLHRSGAWLDGMTYALLADEWRSRRP
jgi:RimJ/RimL family protein N-acetyltransferase